MVEPTSPTAGVDEESRRGGRFSTAIRSERVIEVFRKVELVVAQ
jgi:hypothetical protein